MKSKLLSFLFFTFLRNGAWCGYESFFISSAAKMAQFFELS